MSPRLRRVLIWLAYGVGYFFTLLVFAYLTFPYDRLKERIVSEFNARQTGPQPSRLELDDIDSYWLSGIETEGVRLITPSPPPSDASKKAEKPKVMSIDEAHVRVSILSLLIGNRVMTFGADAFGGSIDGEVADSESQRNVELELEEVDLSQAPILADAIGLPTFGKLSGTATLDSPEARLSKAEGKVSMKIAELGVGDGKAKIRDTIALPRLDAGELVLEADVKAGQLKISQFSAAGPDLEFNAEGTIRLRDQLDNSTLSLNVKFKFTERYVNKNELTKSLFGSTGLFDLDPKNKRAKRSDGFYGWRVGGTISKPIFTPSASDAGGSSARKGKGSAAH